MHNPLFQNILPEDIPVMLKRLHAYTKSYPKEEYIRHAGDPADFIGIVESGSIHVLQDDYYGNRNITASISEGSLFGEAFVCAGIPHLPVDIVAAEDCRSSLPPSGRQWRSATATQFPDTLPVRTGCSASASPPRSRRRTPADLQSQDSVR